MSLIGIERFQFHRFFFYRTALKVIVQRRFFESILRIEFNAQSSIILPPLLLPFFFGNLFRWRSCTWTRPCSNSTKCQRSPRLYWHRSRRPVWQWTLFAVGKSHTTSRTWPIRSTNTSPRLIGKLEVSSKIGPFFFNC